MPVQQHHSRKKTDKVTKRVFVIGANTLQNELMASELQERTGFSCSAVSNMEQIAHAGRADGARLFLYDCLHRSGKACLADLKRDGQHLKALFNLEKDTGLERSAFSCGARGFFYKEDRFSLLVKGLPGMFAGELWISRRLLSQWIPRETPLTRPSGTLLSARENEILALLAGGATTKEIGAVLFISPHTVKNHLQRIFRKIHVHSKTEAAVWAAKHL